MLAKRFLLFFQLCFCISKIKCNTDDEPKDFSIFIIGAGASGIAAATKLLKNNITNIRILEAQDRIGGRIDSMKFGDAFIDLGAQFCHGESNNIVYDMVKDLNILKRSQKDNAFFFQSSGSEINGRLSEKILKLINDISYDVNDPCSTFESTGDCLDVKFEKLYNNTVGEEDKKILNKTKLWAHNCIAGYESPLDLHDMSTKSQFEVSDGDLHLSWNGLGYKTILDILMQKYPPTATPLAIDNKIWLNKRVTKISNWDKNDKSIEVSCQDGTWYTADLVLFSPSLGVLKADHQKIFEPPLPQDKVDAIDNLGFGSILKIFIEFSENSTLDYEILSIFREDEFDKKKNLSWLTALVALVPEPNNPRVIVGWYGGKELPRIELLSDEEVFEGQRYLVNNFLWEHFREVDILSKPTRITRQKWYTNPNFRGTYTYESVKGANKGKDWFEEMAKPLFNKDGESRVLFMGEATNPKHYSTVHGAIESGYREAQKIIDKFGK